MILLRGACVRKLAISTAFKCDRDLTTQPHLKKNGRILLNETFGVGHIFRNQNSDCRRPTCYPTELKLLLYSYLTPEISNERLKFVFM